MKSRRRSKSQKRSKSRRRLKSCKCDGGREHDRHEPRRPGVWLSQCEREVPDRFPKSIAQKDVRGTGHSAPSNDLSKFLKLKDEVVKNTQSYIRRCATVISRTLSPNHEAVKCLSAFGDQAQKFVAEVLTTIEWGTQHWKFQETFPVPVIPRWLRTPKFTQTTTPLRGELPTGGHFEDIRVRCLAMWSWMAILLQYWQDHMTPHLTYIPQFSIAKVGMLPKMSPITDQENALLNLAPGSPVTHATPPGLSRGKSGSGHSSCSGNPMLLGSPAVGSGLALAIKVGTHLGTPSTFGGWGELPRGAIEEEEEEMDAAGN